MILSLMLSASSFLRILHMEFSLMLALTCICKLGMEATEVGVGTQFWSITLPWRRQLRAGISMIPRRSMLMYIFLIIRLAAKGFERTTVSRNTGVLTSRQ